jgi:hypothetical protein
MGLFGQPFIEREQGIDFRGSGNLLAQTGNLQCPQQLGAFGA